MLVPLVRILVRSGVLYRDFADIVKAVYVHVAAEENSVPNRAASVARVAIVTGLPRHDVLRLFAESARFSKALESNATAIANLLKGWHTDSKFTGPYGVPRELPFTPAGEALAFVDLAADYAPGISPRAILDELLRVRAAVIAPESGLIRVEKQTYIPEKMAPEQVEVFARGVRRYAETIDHNLRQDDASQRRFERWVFPDFGIRQKDWPAFRKLVTERLQDVVQDLDTKFGGFEPPEPAATDAMRVGVGMYLYNDETRDEELFAIGSKVQRSYFDKQIESLSQDQKEG